MQELYPDYFKNLKDEEIMAGNAADAYDRLRESIIKNAIAKAQQKRVEELADELQARLEKISTITKAIKKLDDEFDPNDPKWKDIPEDKRKQGDPYYSMKGFYETELEKAKTEAEDFQSAMKEISDMINIEDLYGTIGGGKNSKTSNAKEETAKNYDEIRAIVIAYTKETIAERLSLTEEGSKEEYDMTLKYIDIQLLEKQVKLAKQYKTDKEELEKSLKLKQITQEQYNEQLALIEAQFQDQSQLLVQQSLKKKTEAQKKYTESVVKTIQQQYTKEQSQRDLSLIQEQTALAKQRAQKIISEEEYQRQLAELQQRYAIEAANKQVEMLEKVLAVENITAEEREKIAQKLAEVKIKLAKQIADEEVKQTKRSEKEDEKASEKKTRTMKKYLQTASKMIGQLNSLVSAIYDGQLEKIDQEKDANEERYEKEIEEIENLQETGAISQEEAEARKRAAEQRTAEKEEELEKKKQEIKYKQAVWGKATAIAQAGISTAVAITEALPNVVLAALVGAMGAMEVATILATPIATYAKGTGKDGHKGGLALVGDGGKQEAVVYDGKMWITPDTPTLVDMPKGAMVYPDANKIPEPVLQNVSMTKDSKPVVIVNTDTRKLEKGMDKNNRLLQHAIIATQRAQYNANYQAYKARL